MIACEVPDADWLPFRPLGSSKSIRGRADETVYVLRTPVAAGAELTWPSSL
jgi:hypothetical protein